MQVVRHSRQVIQDRLLAALEDTTKVAILADANDLDILVSALAVASAHLPGDERFADFLKDLMLLRESSGV